MTVRRVALVTGATDGLGRQVAEQLAAEDLHVVVHGRDASRGRAAVAAIEAAGGEASFHAADFASFEAVRRLAASLLAAHAQIDLLIHNAGIAVPGGERRLSAEGHELHLAVNYLAPFLLTALLRPCLGRARPTRIINIASAGQSALDFDDLMLTGRYDGMRAYGQSKLADIMFSLDLAQGGAGGVCSASVHPGTFMDTHMVRAAGIRPLTPVATGVAAVLALVCAPQERINGRYFNGQREARAHAQAYDRIARQKLRQRSLELTGQ